MKKILLALIIASSLFAEDLKDTVKDAVTDLFSSLSGESIIKLLQESNVTKNIEMCYEPDIPSMPDISGLCSAIDFQVNTSIDTCANLPEIPFLKKKSQSETIGFSTNALKSYCGQSVEDKISSVTSEAEIWASDNEYEDGTVKLPNGLTKEEFYKEILDFNELKKRRNESLPAMYFSSKEPFHQETAKYLIDLAKLKKVDDVTDIKAEDIKVAENMIAYEKQVNELSATVSSDIEIASVNSISSKLSSQLGSYTDATGQDAQNNVALSYAAKLKELVKKNSRTKKGMYKSLLSSPEDLAIPTQQTLDLYKDNIKPKYAMLIRKQQQREAYINALIDSEVKIRQDIIDLTAKKSVIMKSTFDEQGAMDIIDNYVD